MLAKATQEKPCFIKLSVNKIASKIHRRSRNTIRKKIFSSYNSQTGKNYTHFKMCRYIKHT